MWTYPGDFCGALLEEEKRQPNLPVGRWEIMLHYGPLMVVYNRFSFMIYVVIESTFAEH